jgi:hypothetical protein
MAAISGKRFRTRSPLFTRFGFFDGLVLDYQRKMQIVAPIADLPLHTRLHSLAC